MKQLNILFFSLLIVMASSCSLFEEESCPEKDCNTGSLNAETCECDCIDGFTGTNCEIAPLCDRDTYIEGTWTVTDYLSIITNADGSESARYTGESGTATFNGDGTGSINAPTTGGTINQNITYTTGTRLVNIIYAGETSRTYAFSFDECSDDEVRITATVSWSGNRTFTETYALSRQ